MNRVPLRMAVFIGILSLGAFVAWLGGYDFDTRNFWVAYGAVHVIGLAGFCAFSPFFIEDEQ